MADSFPLSWPDGWPRIAAHKRTSSRFGKNLGPSQINELKHELKLLGATHITLSSNVPVRNDGIPYANEGRRKYDDPGVAVWFQLDDESRSMARDPYTTPWENVRSLVLAIQSLRSLERHGGSTMVKRAFSGFAALAAPAAAREWWDVLEVTRNASRAVIEANFRRLAMDNHPDRGGSPQKMSELNLARMAAFAATKAA